MSLDTEYYVLEGENNEHAPLFGTDGESTVGYSAFDSIYPVTLEKDDHLIFAMDAPIPEQPQLADYLETPDPIIDEKIKKVLDSITLAGSQYFPASVRFDGKLHDNYYFWNIYLEIACLHKERSKYDWDKEDPDFYTVEAISLDEVILNRISESGRWVFRLRESTSRILVHESVVEKVMAIKPTGIRFICVDEWNIGSAFR
ncbi:MAG: hypothetical protein GXP14_02400 [Gammaproteobacteria bacterium]|nr:hypothetical protein [Gammaproteobacteria bacterium]